MKFPIYKNFLESKYLYVTPKTRELVKFLLCVPVMPGVNLISEIECSGLLEVFLGRFKVMLSTSAPPHILSKFSIY
jgi:hypothetical protein